MRPLPHHATVPVLAALLALAVLIAVSGPGRAAIERPSYRAGDHWVYVLTGSLANLPGMNASGSGVTRLVLSGIAEVDILGPAPGGVRAETLATGFLNGSFAILNTTIDVSGTFSSDTSEIWESQDYLPVVSNTSMAYALDVKLVITTKVTANVWANASLSYASLPLFNLSVGDSATTSVTTEVQTATSFSAFGFSQWFENRTSAAGTWARTVLGQETVAVDAGTFDAYRLNESLAGFPGISGIAPTSGANETAWFSNGVGNDVKRTAYLNGTPVAEMRLKSYAYAAPPPGTSLAETALIIAVPVLVAAVLLVFFLRRRRKASGAAKGSSGAGPVGELPPKQDGGPP